MTKIELKVIEQGFCSSEEENKFRSNFYIASLTETILKFEDFFLF